MSPTLRVTPWAKSRAEAEVNRTIIAATKAVTIARPAKRARSVRGKVEFCIHPLLRGQIGNLAEKIAVLEKFRGTGRFSVDQFALSQHGQIEVFSRKLWQP